jgi:N-acetyltransferase
MLMNLQQSIILQDTRVLLKPMQHADFFRLLPFALNEPDLWRYSVVQPIGSQGMAKYVRLAVGARNSGKEFPFIIMDKTTRTYIGSTRLFDVNIQTKCAQIGYTWYGGKYQGKGINKHCKYLLLEWAFEEMGFERIECRVDSENHKSIRSLNNIGYKQEGILRSNGIRADGTRRNSIVFSILKSEWLSEIKSRLQELMHMPALQQQAINLGIRSEPTSFDKNSIQTNDRLLVK